jgi:hypothetical protein
MDEWIVTILETLAGDTIQKNLQFEKTALKSVHKPQA